MSKTQTLITITLWVLAMAVFVWYGYYFYTPPVKVCEEDVAFVERRFGVDRRLDELEFAPADHIVYKRDVCHFE